ncbi:hypothetical protein ACFSTD_22185 [Novosphingobium colocasiae]|uniref:Uncharacterized protein n=1 Tax=Novosphingobium colocasiae TaxID=1256513 RepID=A0A918PF32_9SPHN|nr:hypothetical protein [Novosphingobium colocasiae]GGZ05362.1 hypothetical protein GCM10011614_20420 [Novosphingobium colocasiae]
MKRAGPLALALACAAAFAASPAAARDRPPGRAGAGTANPSALVAAEIAFARAAREKGQWTAFREFAADGAVMFTPQPVLARAWLKDRANPATALQWQPDTVWMSCDGTLGVTRGTWQRPDGTTGWFTTVWQRQSKGRGKGGYLWLLDQGDSAAAPSAPDDMLHASVGECPARGSRTGPPPGDETAEDDAPPQPPGKTGGGTSRDGTLGWQWSVADNGARLFTVTLRKGGAMVEVLRTQVAAAPAG